MVEERRQLETELSQLRHKLATGDGADANKLGGVKDVGGIQLIMRALGNTPARELKSMVDDLKNKLGSGVVAICGVYDGKASLVVGVTNDLTDIINAVTLVKRGASELAGKGGGGRPDMAQAGGPNAGKVDDALAAIEQVLSGA